MLQKRDDALVVEVPVTYVVADFNPGVPGMYAAFQFLASGFGILQGDLAKSQQAARGGRPYIQSQVVEHPAIREACIGSSV